MTATYTLKVLTEFASAHTLRGYPGACARLHGHNWKLEMEIKAHRLDELGMVIDFKRIKEIARAIGDRLDHRYLNEIAPFDDLNPTAENIARYFYREAARLLNGPEVRMAAVTLWETDRACVRYEEDEPAR
jgi:6-pyruvoyltetrahydropterin/6-carboxytetrahydropterin synthase